MHGRACLPVQRAMIQEDVAVPADVAIQREVLLGSPQARLALLEQLLGFPEAACQRCRAPGQLRRVWQALQLKSAHFWCEVASKRKSNNRVRLALLTQLLGFPEAASSAAVPQGSCAGSGKPSSSNLHSSGVMTLAKGNQRT